MQCPPCFTLEPDGGAGYGAAAAGGRRNQPGHEIEYPLAVVILGGLVTSTLLNRFVLPPLFLRFGRTAASSD